MSDGTVLESTSDEGLLPEGALPDRESEEGLAFSGLEGIMEEAALDTPCNGVAISEI